jgi:Uma2 family endonuclease
MAVEILRRRFTVEEFRRMGQAGIFKDDDRVELLNGEVTQMTPIGSLHAACVNRLNLLFAPLGGRALVAVQNPVTLGSHSEPQPDLALLRPRADFYAHAHPTAADLFLVVEVADTTAAADRSVKLPLYARAGIPEVWLVDPDGQAVEVYRRPQAGAYTDAQRLERGRSLSCELVPDVSFPVDRVLG